jgi:hypothetical protein
LLRFARNDDRGSTQIQFGLAPRMREARAKLAGVKDRQRLGHGATSH